MSEPKHIIKEFKTGYYLIPDHSVPVPTSFETSDTMIDPFCDPRNPKKVTFHEITSAAFLIQSGIEKTPCPVIKKNSVTEFVTIFLTDYSLLISAVECIRFLWHGFVFEKGLLTIYWQVSGIVFDIVAYLSTYKAFTT